MYAGQLLKVVQHAEGFLTQAMCLEPCHLRRGQDVVPQVGTQGMVSGLAHPALACCLKELNPLIVATCCMLIEQNSQIPPHQ